CSFGLVVTTGALPCISSAALGITILVALRARGDMTTIAARIIPQARSAMAGSVTRHSCVPTRRGRCTPGNAGCSLHRPAVPGHRRPWSLGVRVIAPHYLKRARNSAGDETVAWLIGMGFDILSPLAKETVK